MTWSTLCGPGPEIISQTNMMTYMTWGRYLSHPLIFSESDDTEHLAEDGLLMQQFIELLQERNSPLFAHPWQEVVVDAPLPEEGICPPATLLDFHQALKARKYSRLLSSQGKGKPGPKDRRRNSSRLSLR